MLWKWGMLAGLNTHYALKIRRKKAEFLCRSAARTTHSGTRVEHLA